MKYFKIINSILDKPIFISIDNSSQKDLKAILIYCQKLIEKETEVSVHVSTEGLLKVLKKHFKIKEYNNLDFYDTIILFDLRLTNPKKIKKIKQILGNKSELTILLSEYILEEDIKQQYYNKIQSKHKIKLF